VLKKVSVFCSIHHYSCDNGYEMQQQDFFSSHKFLSRKLVSKWTTAVHI